MNLLSWVRPITLNPQEARQDKIGITIGEWRVCATDQTISAFIQFLGRNQRNSLVFPKRIFQASNEHMPMVGRTKSIKILGSNNTGSRPLISGTLKIRRNPSQQFILELEASINPTKFCVYYQRRRRLSHNQEVTNISTLTARGTIRSYGDEYSLDGKDNVLLSPVANANASEGFYEQNLRTYLRSICEYLNSEINEFNSLDNQLNFLGITQFLSPTHKNN